MSTRQLLEDAKQSIRYGEQDPLPVMEQFYTLQGEGIWAGSAAYFVRLAGCDVGCHWCDVKESWSVAPSQYISVAEIAAQAKATGANRVVITGGEPSIYDLSALTRSLHEASMFVHIETAGVHAPSGDIDWICLSPKKFLTAQEAWFQLAHELKVIISIEQDLIWAETLAARCHPDTQLLLQAEWSRKEQVHPLLIDYIKKFPRWRLSIQTHKHLDIP
jgi:7-carboxy-7-deazaguanine synthase